MLMIELEYKYICDACIELLEIGPLLAAKVEETTPCASHSFPTHVRDFRRHV